MKTSIESPAIWKYLESELCRLMHNAEAGRGWAESSPDKDPETVAYFAGSLLGIASDCNRLFRGILETYHRHQAEQIAQVHPGTIAHPIGIPRPTD